MYCMDFPGSPVVKILHSNAGGAGSIPGQGAQIPHDSWPKKQNIKQKQYRNKFNKDFKKKGPHHKISLKNLKNMYCRIHRYRFESVIHDLRCEFDPAIKTTVSQFPFFKKDDNNDTYLRVCW